MGALLPGLDCGTPLLGCLIGDEALVVRDTQLTAGEGWLSCLGRVAPPCLCVPQSSVSWASQVSLKALVTVRAHFSSPILTSTPRLHASPLTGRSRRPEGTPKEWEEVAVGTEGLGLWWGGGHITNWEPS